MNSLKKNLFYQSAYQILQIILPLVTAPYIARVLGPEKIGIYSYTFNVASYFMIFANLGIANYGNREIAKARQNYEKLNQTFSNIVSLHMGLTIVMMLFYTLYLCFWKKDIYSYICFIYLIGTFFDINWFFFGIEKFKITVTRNTIIRLISVVSIFIFVKDQNDLWKYILIMALGNAIGQSAVWIVVPQYIKLVKPQWKEIKKHVKPLLILFIPVIAVSLYKSMDKIMIGTFSNNTQLGYFENAEKIINIPLSLITAVGTVMLPKMSNMVASGNSKQILNYIKISIKYVMIIAIAFSFGTAAIAPVFTPLFFGKSFIESGVLIQMLSITIPFIAFANVLRTQFLIPNSYDRSYTISILLGAGLNVIVNVLLIPQLGALGAVIGTIIAETSVCLIQSVAVSNRLPILQYVKESIYFIFLGLGMYFLIIKMGQKCESTFWTLGCQILVGGVVYVTGAMIFLYNTRDEIFLNILNHLKYKIEKRKKI